MKEADLYPPVKAFLERQGFQVKAEVSHCDLLAVRGAEPPVVVELKLSLNLEVLLQAVDRTRLAEAVYVAVPEAGARARLSSRGARRGIKRLFRMLGLGLMTVGLRTPSGRERAAPRIEVLVEPAPYVPRKNLRHQRRLEREFLGRVGDFNTGGSHRARRITAYRQDALLCAVYLDENGTCAPATVRKATGIERCPALLYRNVYGWFERPAAGRYQISDTGRAALVHYREVVEALRSK